MGLTPEEFRDTIAQSETLAPALRGAAGRGRHGEPANLGAGVRRPRSANCSSARSSRRTSTARRSRTTPANSTRSNPATVGQPDGLHADGRRAVIAAADRSVRFYDVEGRRDLKRFVGHTASVWAVALSARQHGSPSPGAWTAPPACGTWHPARTASEVRASTPAWCSAVAFNPNGHWGISGGFDGVVAAWKVATGEEIWRVEKLGTVTAMAVDPARALRTGRRQSVCPPARSGDRQDDSLARPVADSGRQSRRQPEW